MRYAALIGSLGIVLILIAACSTAAPTEPLERTQTAAQHGPNAALWVWETAPTWNPGSISETADIR